MRFLSAKLMHPCSCTLALSALAIIALTAANLAPSIPAPSAFRAVADGRWTPQYRLNWAYSDAIDYLYFEVARNCSDGRTVFIRVDDKSMTDYFDIKSLRCTYAVRAVSIASASPFSVSVTVGFGGLPSAPYSIESVLPTKANTLQVRYTAVTDAGSGDAITVSIVNYRVEYSTDVNFTFVECKTDSQDSGVFVQSCVLTKSRSYYVRVSAANTVGYGPPIVFTRGTASPVAVRVVDLPSPPRSINSIIHSGEYELTMDFYLPLDTGCGDISEPIVSCPGMAVPCFLCDLTFIQVSYTVDVDDAPFFQSVDFSVRAPAVWPHASIATPISIAVGGLPLNTPLYIRIRASNQVGLGPPLVLGGEGRSVPPPSAAVFVFAKPAAPTVLSVFASASLELSVIFAPPPDSGSGVKNFASQDVLRIPSGRPSAWLGSPSGDATRVPAPGIDKKTQMQSRTRVTPRPPILEFVVEIDDDPGFHSVDAVIRVPSSSVTSEGRASSTSNFEGGLRAQMPLNDPLRNAYIKGFNLTQAIAGSLEAAALLAGQRGTASEKAGGLESLYDYLWLDEAWQWANVGILAGTLNTEGSKMNRSSYSPPWGEDQTTKRDWFSTPYADAIKVVFKGLVKGQFYHARVYATNELGAGAPGVMGAPVDAPLLYSNPPPALRLRYLSSGVVGCEVKKYLGCSWGGARLRGFPQHSPGLQIHYRFEGAGGTGVYDPILDANPLRAKLLAPRDTVSAAYTAAHPKVNSVFSPSFMRSSNFSSLIQGLALFQSSVLYDGAIFNTSIDMTLLTYDMSSNNYDCFILGDVTSLNLGGMFGGVAYIGPRTLLSGGGHSYSGGALVVPNVFARGILDWSIILYVQGQNWEGKRCLLILPGSGAGSQANRRQNSPYNVSGSVPDSSSEEGWPQLLGSAALDADFALCFVQGVPIIVLEQTVMLSALAPFPVNQTVHVFFRYEAASMALQLYLDGSLVNQWESAPRLRSRSPWILVGGSLPPVDADKAKVASAGLDQLGQVPTSLPLLPFQGWVDGIRLYTRALSSSDIKALLAMPATMEELPFRVQAIDVPGPPSAVLQYSSVAAGHLSVSFLPPLDYGAGVHRDAWLSVPSNAAALARPQLLPSVPQTGFNAVNASALSAPLSTDVTLVSHKVEFSEDSSFSSISKIECSIEGFTPIAGNTINVNPETGVVQMDCKGLTLGRFYYVRISSSNVLGFGPARTFSFNSTGSSGFYTSVRASGNWWLNRHQSQEL